MGQMRDILWIAGLLEGEGCFTWSQHAAHIRLAMTDEDVVARAARILGTTSLRSRPPGARGKRRVYLTQLCGRRAIGWMLTLYPLLALRRRERIRTVLAEWRSRPAKRRAIGLCARCAVRLRMFQRNVCRGCHNDDQRIAAAQRRAS